MYNEKIETLPVSIQNEIRETLKAYDEVNVEFEYGEYRVLTGVMLTATYAPDHRFVGTYKANEVFTLEERTINYAESFHDFPIWYKGKRDYRMMNDCGYDWSIKFKMENGNLVRA